MIELTPEEVAVLRVLKCGPISVVEADRIFGSDLCLKMDDKNLLAIQVGVKDGRIRARLRATDQGRAALAEFEAKKS